MSALSVTNLLSRKRSLIAYSCVSFGYGSPVCFSNVSWMKSGFPILKKNCWCAWMSCTSWLCCGVLSGLWNSLCSIGW